MTITIDSFDHKRVELVDNKGQITRMILWCYGSFGIHIKYCKDCEKDHCTILHMHKNDNGTIGEQLDTLDECVEVISKLYNIKANWDIEIPGDISEEENENISKIFRKPKEEDQSSLHCGKCSKVLMTGISKSERDTIVEVCGNFLPDFILVPLCPKCMTEIAAESPNFIQNIK